MKHRKPPDLLVPGVGALFLGLLFVQMEGEGNAFFVLPGLLLAILGGTATLAGAVAVGIRVGLQPAERDKRDTTQIEAKPV